MYKNFMQGFVYELITTEKIEYKDYIGILV